jgi:hypothetical protein
MKSKVYIAGPYTIPDPVENTREAIMVADILFEKGFIPFVPHLNILWHLIVPRQETDWLEWDLEWLKACDYILRIPGKSKGADLEMKMAKQWGIPILKMENLLNDATSM